MRSLSSLAVLALLLVCTAAVLPLDAQKRGRTPARPATKPTPAAPKAPPPPPSVERAVPFKTGETLTYDVSWSKYLTAGTATMKVQEKRPSFGSTAYYIVAEGKPSGLVASLYSLYYKADTLLDVYTLLPQRGSLYSQEGKRHRMKVTRFDQGTRRADYEVRTASIVKKTLPLPPLVQDSLSAVYVLRAIRLKEGDRFVMPISDGGVNYRVTFAVGKAEPVKVGLGTFPAFPVTPVIRDARGAAVGRPMTLWIGTDPRHLPLQLKADLPVGSFNLMLREAK